MKRKSDHRTFFGSTRRWLVLRTLDNGAATAFLPLMAVLLLAAPSQPRAANWNPLADTGLKKRYDQYHREIDRAAANGAGYGQNARYQGPPLAYRDNGDQTVTDLNTTLVWMRSDDHTARSWPEAIDYCDRLVFAGHQDWRLPTRFELDSIVHYGRAFPAMASIFDCRASFYWSSDSYAGDRDYAWGIYGDDGADHWLAKTNCYAVRCVRTDR